MQQMYWLCSNFDLDSGGVSVVRNPSDQSSRVERTSVFHAVVGPFQSL